MNPSFLTLSLVLGSAWVTYGQGAITSASVSEGACVNPAPQNNPQAWAFIFGTTTAWYIPIANQYLYAKYAEILLGGPAANATQLASMKLRLQCTTVTCIASGPGFSGSPFFTQLCVPSEFDLLNPALINAYTCSPVNLRLTYSAGANPAALPPYRNSVIWTDLSNTVLLNECVGGNRAFAVLSKTPTLSPSTQATVLAQVTAAGYDPAYVQYMSY